MYVCMYVLYCIVLYCIVAAEIVLLMMIVIGTVDVVIDLRDCGHYSQCGD